MYSNGVQVSLRDDVMMMLQIKAYDVTMTLSGMM